jgi:hypothetical protein
MTLNMGIPSFQWWRRSLNEPQGLRKVTWGAFGGWQRTPLLKALGWDMILRTYFIVPLKHALINFVKYLNFMILVGFTEIADM